MSRLSAYIRRWQERRMAARSPAPPSRFAIFDHVPKTGGTAINHALLKIFSAEHVAVNRHIDIAAGKLDFAGRYPIITGHFGGRWRREFKASRNRLAFTVIRDPVNRAISTYSFWRHKIPRQSPYFSLPNVQAAQTLSFSAFIRSNIKPIKINLFNTHYALLAHGEAYETVCEPAGQARYRSKIADLVEEFSVIGVTERLPETLQCFFTAIGFHERLDLPALLAQVEKNASPTLGNADISSEDRAFIIERNEVDSELHAVAGARLDRLLGIPSKAAANEPP